MHDVMGIATEEGEDIIIREDDLARFPEAELKRLRISRQELRRVFAKGVKLPQVENSPHVVPTAYEKRGGGWVVRLIDYSDNPPFLELLAIVKARAEAEQ